MSGSTRSTRSPRSTRPRPPVQHSSRPWLAWGAVGLVVVIVISLVIVKIAVGNGATSSSHQTLRPASPQLVHELTTVPASVFDSVGVAIPSGLAGGTPIVVSGQPPLHLGGTTPTVLYYGAEYCPYCAAERWAIVIALSRFGTWSGLQTTASGLQDGDYSTLSFRTARFTSPYVHFASIEACTNVVDPTASGCSGYSRLQNPTPAEQKVLDTYAGSRFVPGNTEGISFPYIDVDNQVLFSGSTYQPGILAGLSQSDIAGVLTDPTDPLTKAIIGTADYLTASICRGTGGQPSTVCTSPGVEAADAALRAVTPTR